MSTTARGVAKFAAAGRAGDGLAAAGDDPAFPVASADVPAVVPAAAGWCWPARYATSPASSPTRRTTTTTIATIRGRHQRPGRFAGGAGGGAGGCHPVWMG